MGEAQRDEIAKLEALYAANPEGRVFTHLAEAYRKAGNLERAREILEEGLSRHPDSGTAFVVLGRVAFDSDRPEDAREAFGRALTLDGGNLVAHRYLGELALGRGDRESARRHFEELLARNPTDESLLTRLRELSAPTLEEQSSAADAPALAEPTQADDSPYAGYGAASAADEPAPAADAGAAGDGWVEEGGSWSLPSEGFSGETEEGEPLPNLELAPADETFAEPGTSAEPWSWDETPAEPAEFEGLDDFGTVEGLEGTGWDEPESESELPHLEGLEPLPEFEAPPLEDEDPAEPASWLAEAPDSGAADDAGDAADTGLPWLLPEAESLEPAPAADEYADARSVDVGDPPPWRPYAVGEAAVPEALADAGAVESSATWPSEDAAAPAPSLLPGRPDDVMTETIAELYLTQGFAGRAADVYRSLLLRHPDDARLQERLAEAERRAATETSPVAPADEGAGAEWGEQASSSGEWSEEASVIGEAPETPATAAGAPIATYFRSLLDWRPAAHPEPAPVDEALAAPPAEESGTGAETAAAAADADESAPEQPQTGGWEAADSWAFVEAEDEPTVEPEAEVLPELTLDDPAPDAESFEGWTPDMLLEPEAGAPERMPWEVPEPASLAVPEPEADGEAVTAPEGAVAADSAGELDAMKAAEPEPPTDDEEDEDLEMFRSWLQSLKK